MSFNGGNPLGSKDGVWFFAQMSAFREITHWLNRRKTLKQQKRDAQAAEPTALQTPSDQMEHKGNKA